MLQTTGIKRAISTYSPSVISVNHWLVLFVYKYCASKTASYPGFNPTLALNVKELARE